MNKEQVKEGCGQVNRNDTNRYNSLSCEDAAVCYGDVDGKTMAVRDKMTTLLDVKFIDRVALKIHRSKSGVDCFRVCTDNRSRRSRLDRNVLGKSIEAALRIDYRAIADLFSFHKLNPYVALFVEEARKRCLDEVALDIPFMGEDDMVRWVDVLNGFVRSVRDESKGAKFKARWRDYYRSSQENAKELRGYIDAIFKAYAKVMVIRVDLGYKKDVTRSASGQTLEFERVRCDREQFFRRLQEKELKNSWIGYAWKLEYGFDKSFHHHVIIFLNGAVVREDAVICKMVGDLWADKITAGDGLYYNCNARFFRYKRLGIGVIDHADAQKVAALKFDVASYLTKSDHYARLMLPDRVRVFGKGKAPRIPAVRRGRPRSKAANPEVQ
jgi:hypothetical protein